VKSLQSRVIVTALIAITVTGLVLVATIAILMRPVLKQNQADALTAVLNAAIALEGTVTPTELAQRITKPGVSVVITKDGRSFSDGKGLGAGLGLNGIPGDFQLIPLPGFNHRMTGQDDGYLLVEDYLPNSQSIITVAAANVEAIDLFSEIMEIGLPAMLVLMLVIALALRSAMRAALKPLDDMTSLATQIASGERGRRLDVEDKSSELGRTAEAFDNMLDSLETSLTRAEDAEDGMRQLCADVAHELRSPLASIVAGADNLMRSDGKRATLEKTAIAVVREGNRAARIVRDLTLATQLDNNGIAHTQINKRPIDIVSLVASGVEFFASQSAFAVKLEADPSLEKLDLYLDPERVQQALTNLLENANRWAETKIAIRTGITTDQADGSHDSFWVQVYNDGPAVPEADRERIFERFVRLEPDRARSTGGSGLGLSISRALIEAHGGSLICLPAEGGSLSGASLPTELQTGATFELRLPVVAPPAEAYALAEQPNIQDF
jgi:signal transduction histidine kinase